MSSTQLQFRRDTAANWSANNPTLAQGEVGLETDTNAYKIGDGATAWTSLNYNQLAPEITTLLLDGQSSDATAPIAGDLTVYSKSIGGRMMLKQIGPSGLATAFQPFLGRNKVGYWCPPGNATTVPGVFGYTAPTVLTVATRTIAATNLFTRMRRLGYASAATAGSLAYEYVNQAQVTIGDGSGNGGFYKVCRFGISDTTSAVAAARMFCGVSSSVATPTNVDPATLTNSIGIGAGAAQTTMHVYYGGSAAQTPIDLGSNFPVNSTSLDVYELVLFAPSSSNNTVYYEVTRINTGNVATGTLTGTAGTVLPSSSTLLSYHRLWRTNNTTAAVVAFDVMSDYIETDN